MKSMKKMHLITAVVPTGKGFPLIQHLHENGHHMTNLHHARGSFIGNLDPKGRPIEGEQEVITCVIEDEKAANIFRDLYEKAEIHRPGHGFMYMEKLNQGTNYDLPKV